ncbi:MAG TPA: phosphodiester glycosidase family protein [Steroidobacteraceae bacterium]|nr:phosphodiester glycosidase family protein [Steroidobacteraceae bacterium]
MIPGKLAGMFARQMMLTMFALATAVPAVAVDCQRRDYGGIGYVVCRVTETEKLTLHLTDERGAIYGDLPALRDALANRGRTLDFAMNAGMFRADQRPVGLLVIDGRELAPINRATASGNFYMQPNGVYLVDAGGPRVVATHDYRNLTPTLATQSGPMLLYRGVVPDLPAFREGSRSRHVRNGVCVPTGRVTALVISEKPVNFREFALFFRDALGCRDALYLDGSISSLYAPSLGRADYGARLGPIFAVIR